MGNLVLIRHGESICNANNIFTGWLDSPLTDKGKNEAVIAGKILEENGYKFDIGFTSVLCRAQETLNIILKELKNENIHIEKSLFLNERHYGSLEGMNKDEVRNIFGSEMVQQWRRGLTERPPKISLDEYDKLVNNPKYKGVSTEYLPFSENIDDVNKRTIKYFKESIEPHLKNGKNVILDSINNNIENMLTNQIKSVEKLIEGLIEEYQEKTHILKPVYKNDLSTDITYLKGVGPNLAKILNKMGIISIEDLFKEVDILISPTCPNTAFDLGAKSSDPLAMYLTDIATISCNLAGIPGMSVPAGFDSDGMPIGLQILAPQMEESRLFNFGYKFEQENDFYKQIANI